QAPAPATIPTSSSALTATANRPPAGYLDAVRSGGVYGLAADPDHPTRAIQAVVGIDGADVATIVADKPRPDVTAVFPQFAGNHGVVYALPATFQDGAQHRLRLFAIDDNGARVELNTSNVPFVWAASGPSAASNSALTATTNRPPAGYLDAVTSGVVQGWAADPDRPTQAIQVVVGVDGADVATIVADKPRPDVTAVFPQFAGNHGVVYALPAMFQDGAQHRLRLFAIDDNGARVELNTSNVPFVWAASGPQPATVTGQFLGVTGEDKVGQGNQTSPNGTP